MKYFITYGDDKYRYSKERIMKQAEAIGVFDKVIGYDKSELSNDVLCCDLMQYQKGGGLWIWKPDILLSTLQIMKEGDVIVYSDSGCTVQESKEWRKYFKCLEEYEILSFFINTHNNEYCKKDILRLFNENRKSWEKNYQIAATFFMMKKTFNTIGLIKEWRNLMLNKPDLVLDVAALDLDNEPPRFKGNRHDQSLFSGLIYKYYLSYKIKIIQNHFEGGRDNLIKQAVIASRISDKNRRSATERALFTNIIYHILIRPMRTFAFYLRLFF